MILGVDIGAAGALALLSSAGELIDIFDMPCLADSAKGRRTVNAPLLAKIVFKYHARKSCVEFVEARPREGAVGAFAFERSRGVVEGALAGAGAPVAFVTPRTWKCAVRLVAGSAGAKEASRSEAIRRWPSKAGLFARSRDDGQAEVAPIGLAGLIRATL